MNELLTEMSIVEGVSFLISYMTYSVLGIWESGVFMFLLLNVLYLVYTLFFFEED